jgi:uncharacterized membrane protein
MFVRLSVWLETIRLRLWLIPAVAVVLAVLGAWLVVEIDRAISTEGEPSIGFGGGPESARSILSTISAAMLTFTGLVFSVTMLVLQLASSQLSPQVTRTFLRDRQNQVVLGIFVATFVYALVVLREIRSPPDPFVPAIAVWLAFVLLLVSVAAFIVYIDHMAHAMRATTVIDSVASETADAIARAFPEPAGSLVPVDLPVPPVSSVVASERGGIVQAIDLGRLKGLARESGAVIESSVGVGDPIVTGAPLVRVRGRTGASLDPEAVRGAFAVGRERTMESDPSYGFRQLVDIALRALSPGVNDPTTARIVVDRLHDLLRRLSARAIPGAQRADPDGALLLIVPVRVWEDYVDLAFDEIRDYGASSTQVVRALREMLEDLESSVTDDRRPVLRRQRAALDAIGSVPPRS